MKTIKFFMAIVALTVSTVTYAAGGTKTETFKVSGNCEMCESTIEKAAKINGVTKADWNKKTKVMTLVYNPAKVKSDAVHKKIAAAGYDTPKFKASKKVYNALPSCCKYK